MFNDFYSRDTSKKIRAVMKARGNSGKHLGKPPYGYLCDPQDKDRWVIDEETAPVVKRIFDMTIAGAGPFRFAAPAARQMAVQQKSHKPICSTGCWLSKVSVFAAVEHYTPASAFRKAFVSFMVEPLAAWGFVRFFWDTPKSGSFQN